MIKKLEMKNFFFSFSNPNRKFFSSCCLYVSVPFYKCEEKQKANKKNSLSKKLAETDTFSFRIQSLRIKFLGSELVFDLKIKVFFSKL